MRLFFLILNCFLSLIVCQSQVNKEPGVAPTKGIVIQNSLPRGNTYTDPAGKGYRYTIFWTRVSNETDTARELSIHFPADTLPVPRSRSLRLFVLPLDTMTPSREASYDYGLTGLASFLDSSLHKPTRLKRILKSKETCFFYVLAVSEAGKAYNGALRAGLILQEQTLYYQINMLDTPVPCGQLGFVSRN